MQYQGIQPLGLEVKTPYGQIWKMECSLRGVDIAYAFQTVGVETPQSGFIQGSMVNKGFRPTGKEYA